MISRNPEWFAIYSSTKFYFIICSVIFCSFFFYIIRKITIPQTIIYSWDKLSDKSTILFLLISAISALPFILKGVHIGEDIGGQVKSSLQWINGQVVAPNILMEPSRNDIAIDQGNWILRPPGSTLIPIIGMRLGLSLGQSIKLGLFLCSIIGTIGWLFIFRRFNVNKNIILIIAIVLALDSGTSICGYGTANVILFALVPWFLKITLAIPSIFKELKIFPQKYLLIAIILFTLGCFAWIKLSGLIVAGTIGAILLFTMMQKKKCIDKLKFILYFGLLGTIFWLPFVLLENINYTFTGSTANQLYSANDSDIQSPLFGKFWGESTKGVLLLWSFISAPGYSLPIKSIAHNFKDFVLQFPELTKWMESYAINVHVLICGIIGLIFTIMLFMEIKKSWSYLEIDHKISIMCFSLIPFIGLAVLANKYEWNYLLYHAHTIEFWIIFTIPTLIIFSHKTKSNQSSIILFAVITALPLNKILERTINSFKQNASNVISSTEKGLDLSSTRFSSAIEVVEKDTRNSLDILYFLPSGDMGDLILRTKMRTIATHFAGGNFPKTNELRTSKSLNVYCVYDSSLANITTFKNALKSKFPQAKFRKRIFSDNVIVDKIELDSLIKPDSRS